MEIKFLNNKNHGFFLALLIFLTVKDIFINLFRCCSLFCKLIGITNWEWNQWLSATKTFSFFSSPDASHENTKGEIALRSSFAFRSRSFLASGATHVEYIHASCHLNPRRLSIREDIHEIAYLPVVKYEIKFIRLFRALIINRTIVAEDRRRSRGL